MLRALLISNSTLHGGSYLDHCAKAIAAFLGPEVERVLFVPFALKDHEAYAAKARERFARMGYALESLHTSSDAEAARKRASAAQAFFVGGGNTFRLLARLQGLGLVDVIRERVRAGTPYIGSSAGSNLAAPTISTTNDMPIVQPASFEALALVPFQINPHYLDPDPGSKHMGETREQRIREYHEEQSRPVVGLREGCWLTVEGREVHLGGTTGARVFRQGREPEEHKPPARLDALLR